MRSDEAVKNRLDMLRKEKHLSMHQLALDAGVPYSTVKNILYGDSHNPGVGTVHLLCMAMGISVPEFFTDEIFLEMTPYDDRE